MWVRPRLLTEEFPEKANAAHSAENPSQAKERRTMLKDEGTAAEGKSTPHLAALGCTDAPGPRTCS